MGGKVFETTSRIPREFVVSTFLEFEKQILHPLGLRNRTDRELGSYYSLIGSAGKKKDSGDIDVAISLPVLKSMHQEDMIHHIITSQMKKKGVPFKVISSGDIISCDFPIYRGYGTQDCNTVQIDLMLSPNLGFSRWMFYAPSESESDWSGKYRNILLSTITSFAEKKVIEEKDGIELLWEKPLLNYSRGLFLSTQTRIGKMKTLKTPKTTHKEFITNSPEIIVKILVGDAFHAESLLTFESLWSAIHAPYFAHKKFLPDIIAAFALNATANNGYGYVKMQSKI